MLNSEFRIGNYLYFPFHSEIVKIIGIPVRKDGTQLIQIETKGSFLCEPLLEQFKFVPITDDLLIKFGFEKLNGRHGEYFKHHFYTLFRIWKISDDTWGVGRKDEASKDREYNTNWICLDYKYIHQVQNIFFLLTNQELKINK